MINTGKHIPLINRNIILIFLFFITISALGQQDTVQYKVELSGTVSSGKYSPSLLHFNQYGKYSTDPTNQTVSLGLSKDITKKLFSYSFGVSALLQSSPSNSELYLHEYFLKGRLLVFDLTIGAREEQLGNQDKDLSDGGLLFSTNTRPMPKITLGIENFTSVPFTKGYVEVKGALSHGWFTDNTFVTNAFLHHKYAYLKLGGKLPVHIQYGLDHTAQWGGNSTIIGQQPNSLSNYKNIFFGRSGGSDANISDQINALGNHIISQSMRIDVELKDLEIGAYWQNLSEDGPIRPIWSSMNIEDGLWGLSIRTKSFPYISGLVYEFLNTTDQSGPYHDKDGLIYGGSDNYFFNGTYQSGWSYYQRTIGTPYIFPPKFSADSTSMFAVNNRVQVHHLGIMGEISGYKYKTLVSLSKNYGVYGMPEADMKRNSAILLEVQKHFSKLWNLDLGVSLSADYGNLYGNSTGLRISISKSGDLFHY